MDSSGLQSGSMLHPSYMCRSGQTGVNEIDQIQRLSLHRICSGGIMHVSHTHLIREIQCLSLHQARVKLGP